MRSSRDRSMIRGGGHGRPGIHHNGARPPAERHRAARGPVPEHHRHGPGGGHRGLDPGRGRVRRRLPAARRDLRPGRLLVLRLQHRPAGPRDALGRLPGHLRRAGPAPVRGLPGRLGLRPGRVPDPAAGPAPARFHHRRHHQRRMVRLPGQPVVAVVAGRGGDRARGRLLRHPHLGPARHRPRPVRDRGVPGPRGLLRGPCGQRQHPERVHHQVHPARLPRPRRGDRRLGVHHPGLRRIRGGRAAGRGGQEPAADHPAGGAAGHPADRGAVRLHHLRGGRRVRPGQVRQLHHRHRGRRPGRAWPGRCTGCSGSSSSSPS